ncbi:MAG: hypothetical protein KTR25_00325 [Myxococcales bacterium]|nr:hypothetical protein [Myxococcales bacterium]
MRAGLDQPAVKGLMMAKVFPTPAKACEGANLLFVRGEDHLFASCAEAAVGFGPMMMKMLQILQIPTQAGEGANPFL